MAGVPSAWAAAGLTAGEVTSRLAEHGLAVGFGYTDSVGIGGITLSSGIRFLSRRDGLTIHNVLCAEIDRHRRRPGSDRRRQPRP
jgi:FAD/FMN-containing dehydrogenase